MTESTTGVEGGVQAGGPPPAHRAPEVRSTLRGAAVEALVALVVFAAVGAGAGWLWYRLWDPPIGTVLDGTWGYDNFDELGSVFSATGLYVVIGLLGGLLLGVLTALLCRRSELVTLLAVAVGGAVAGYLCYRVGLSLSPPDPTTLAAGLPDGESLPDDLTMPGRSPFVAWPLGALLGLTIVYFLTTGVSAGVGEARRRDADDPRWLRRNQNG